MRSTSDVQLQPGQNRDHGMLNQMRSIVNPAIDNRSMILHRSRESCIVALDSGWRCLRLKCGEIHCPIKDDKNWSTFNDTSQWPEQLRQRESDALQQVLRELPQRSDTERSPKIHAIFRSLILSDVTFGKQ